MRKNTKFVLIFAVLLSLVGCGSREVRQIESVKPSPAGQEQRLGRIESGGNVAVTDAYQRPQQVPQQVPEITSSAPPPEAVSTDTSVFAPSSDDTNVGAIAQEDGLSDSSIEEQNQQFLSARQDTRKNISAQGISQINEQIAVASLQSNPEPIKREEYTLGGGDVIEVAVFQVDDLNRTVRVSNDGYVMLPLVGTLKVEGMTVDQFSSLLTEKLAADYLQNPHVTAFVSEYRSHQIAVMGAVENPNIYNITEPRTILQMIAMAGGLTKEAGDRIFVKKITQDSNGQPRQESLIISLNALIEENDKLDFALGKGDSIMVPKGGTVFVEGAVENPGAYSITGDMNILKALTVAGGLSFEAEKGNIQVFRETSDGQPAIYTTSLAQIREKREDIQLMDGDIVVIDNNAVKQVWGGLWDGVKGIFGINTSIRY